jgi:hypothetical protein
MNNYIYYYYYYYYVVVKFEELQGLRGGGVACMLQCSLIVSLGQQLNIIVLSWMCPKILW